MRALRLPDRLAATLGVLALVLAVPVGMATAAEIVSHRAIYLLTLGSSSSASGIFDARGTMAIEWAASCEGWTVQQRITLKLISNDNREIDADTGFTSWESSDGLKYRFSLRSTRNGELDEELRGHAQLSRPGGPGKAEFITPPDIRMDLPPGAIFPTEHTVLLIERAEAGDLSLLRVVFDGATKEGAAEVNAFIGRPLPPVETHSAIAGRVSWPVRLAYFDLSSDALEPHYELSVRLFDNGIAEELVMDYGDFTVNADINQIEPLAEPEC